MSTYELGVRSPFVIHGIAAYERAFKMLEDTLSEGGPWIVGASPSLADINLMPFTARLDYLGLLDLWIKNRPSVMAWWALAREWPSFKTGLRDLISEAEFSEMRTHGAPPAFAELRRRDPRIGIPQGTALARIVETRQTVQVADVQSEPAYSNDPQRRAGIIGIAGARTLIMERGPRRKVLRSSSSNPLIRLPVR